MTAYPEWIFYPNSVRPPDWVDSFTAAVADAEPLVSSLKNDGLTSDEVLKRLRPRLADLGFDVEAGKRRAHKIRRPVLFGDRGHERVAYEVDGFHDQLGIVLEIEAGRGARGNAIYRDLIRSSLIVEARYFALGVMIEYRRRSGGQLIRVASYVDAKNILDAIFASGRLALPFDGVLLFGY